MKISKLLVGILIATPLIANAAPEIITIHFNKDGTGVANLTWQGPQSMEAVDWQHSVLPSDVEDAVENLVTYPMSSYRPDYGYTLVNPPCQQNESLKEVKVNASSCTFNARPVQSRPEDTVGVYKCEASFTYGKACVSYQAR